MSRHGLRASAGIEDGRVRRGEANREAIVRAMQEIIVATHRPPTVEEVARRAGVGIRTVFRQFRDQETLHRRITERVTPLVLSMAWVGPPSGHLDADLRALVARRARIYEFIAPYRRASRLVRHQSAYLREQDAATQAIFRSRLEAIVAPHLSRRDGLVLEVLDALLSFEMWDRLRDQQQLGVRRAARVLAETAVSLAGASRRRRRAMGPSRR